MFKIEVRMIMITRKFQREKKTKVKGNKVNKIRFKIRALLESLGHQLILKAFLM